MDRQTEAPLAPSALVDVGPGPFERAGIFLGLTDDAPRIERFSARWWTRWSVFAVVLIVIGVLVAYGG